MDDGFRPIGSLHPPLSQAIAAEIKRAILSGRYPPGARLVEDHLAEELGVSRNPVREALRQLEGEGFVDIVPRRGASVATIGHRQAHELFEVRAALEALSARLAAQRITEAEVATLEEIVERGDAAAKAGEVEVLPALNTEFHTQMVLAAGNHQLAGLIAGLRDNIQWVYARHVRHRALDSWAEHRRLFEAVAAGDGDAAAHIALAHIAAAEEAYSTGEEEGLADA